MKMLFPVFVYCISLLSLQLLALPVRNRLDFMTRLHQLREERSVSAEVTEQPKVDHDVSIDRTVLWRAILSRPPPAAPTGHSFQRNQPTEGETAKTSAGPKPRGRRHAHSRHHSHHQGQLMRVGCVLGTCQVQNLSHRLYQLVGQSGREDSPINPRSPHSYG